MDIQAFADFIASSDVFKVVWIVFTVGMAVNHAVYVHHRPIAYSKAATMFMLVLDLIGISGSWIVVKALLGDVPTWLTWCLGIDFVVHTLSGVWVVAHWQSLSDHMREFQERKLPAVAAASEFIYEQFDCALYLVTAGIAISTLPLWMTIPLFIAMSGFGAAFLPTAGFMRSPAQQA